MKALLLLFLATASLAQSPSPIYVFTIRVSGTTVSVDKVDVITPTPVATSTPTPPSGPTPTPTPIAVYIGWSPYPNATDYKVYYKKQDGTSTGNFNSGNVTKTKITFPVGTRWFVSVKPLNAVGTELATSNELSWP